MALSGTHNLCYWTNDNGEKVYLTFVWSATQSIANNTSTISWTLKGTRSSTHYVKAGGFKLTIDGSTVYSKSTDYRIKLYNGTEIASGSKTISHNTDGARSFNVYVEAGIYTYAVNTSGSTTITLDTIPRTSSYSLSASSVNIGNNITVNISRNSDSFTHYVRIWTTDFSKYYQEKNNIGTSTSFTIPTSWYALTNGASSITAYCRVETYVGSTFVGRALDKSFTVTVPSGTGPTIGSFTLDPVDISGQNLLVQTKNKLNISASGCTGGFGSSLSYKITGSDISAQNAQSVTAGPFSSSGTKTYTLTVTDAGGRTATKSASITCYAYTQPSITLTAYRVASSSSTTEDDSGTYVRCSYSLKYSSVNSTNDATVKIYYKKNTASSWASVTALIDSKNTSGSYALSSIAIDSTYTVYATITDNYNGSSLKSNTVTIFSAERILNIRPQGKGIAFGKMADTDNVLDSKWPIRTDAAEQTMKNLTYKGTNVISSTTNDTTSNWGNQGNLATTFYNTTGQITDQPSQYGFVLNLTNGPSSPEVHQIWATQSSGSLLHRGGNSNGWNGSWRTVLDSANYISYVSPKPVKLDTLTTCSGGTITLLDDVSNYTYLEIYYHDNTTSGKIGNQSQSVKVYYPDGNGVDLSCAEAGPTNGRLYLRSTRYDIAGNAITFVRSKIVTFIDGSDYTVTQATSTTDNYVRITRVLGYK